MQVIARYGEITKRDVQGFTMSEAAAKKLAEEAKIQTANTARARVIEERGEEVSTGGSIMILDETSMLDLDALERALDIADKRGVNVKMIGDLAQLQNIGAGATHEIATRVAKENDRYVELTEVRRQRGQLEWMRPMVSEMGKAIRERDADAVKAQLVEYNKHKVFKFMESRTQAVETAAERYHDLTGAGKPVLLLAADRMTGNHLNDAIRGRLGLVGTGQKLFTKDGGYREFAIGERIEFRQNDRRLGGDNGDLATIRELAYDQKRKAWMMTVDRERDGAAITLNATKYQSFSHGYATTVHKSQGPRCVRFAPSR